MMSRITPAFAGSFWDRYSLRIGAYVRSNISRCTGELGS